MAGKPIGEHAMTAAERQARRRARKKEIKASERPWWKQVIDEVRTPSTPDESLQLYWAIGHISYELEHQADPYIVAEGKVLLHARTLFPTIKEWEQWLRSKVKTCPHSTNHANLAIDWAKASRRQTDPSVEADLDAISSWTTKKRRDELKEIWEESRKENQVENDRWMNENPVAKNHMLNVAKARFNELASDQQTAFVEWAQERITPQSPHPDRSAAADNTGSTAPSLAAPPPR